MVILNCDNVCVKAKLYYAITFDTIKRGTPKYQKTRVNNFVNEIFLAKLAIKYFTFMNIAFLATALLTLLQ